MMKIRGLDNKERKFQMKERERENKEESRLSDISEITRM